VFGTVSFELQGMKVTMYTIVFRFFYIISSLFVYGNKVFAHVNDQSVKKVKIKATLVT